MPKFQRRTATEILAKTKKKIALKKCTTRESNGSECHKN